MSRPPPKNLKLWEHNPGAMFAMQSVPRVAAHSPFLSTVTGGVNARKVALRFCSAIAKHRISLLAASKSASRDNVCFRREITFIGLENYLIQRNLTNSHQGQKRAVCFCGLHKFQAGSKPR